MLLPTPHPATSAIHLLGGAVPTLPAQWDQARVLLAVSHGGWQEQLALQPGSSSAKGAATTAPKRHQVSLGWTHLPEGGKGCRLQVYHHLERETS